MKQISRRWFMRTAIGGVAAAVVLRKVEASGPQKLCSPPLSLSQLSKQSRPGDYVSVAGGFHDLRGKPFPDFTGRIVTFRGARFVNIKGTVSATRWAAGGLVTYCIFEWDEELPLPPCGLRL